MDLSSRYFLWSKLLTSWAPSPGRCSHCSPPLPMRPKRSPHRSNASHGHSARRLAKGKEAAGQWSRRWKKHRLDKSSWKGSSRIELTFKGFSNGICCFFVIVLVVFGGFYLLDASMACWLTWTVVWTSADNQTSHNSVSMGLRGLDFRTILYSHEMPWEFCHVKNSSKTVSHVTKKNL